jgi:hypothetical protein
MIHCYQDFPDVHIEIAIHPLTNTHKISEIHGNKQFVSIVVIVKMFTDVYSSSYYTSYYRQLEKLLRSQVFFLICCTIAQ